MNKKNNPNQSGFTLIELLVVIAIIGLLSSVVMGSLASARTKAADSKVLSEKHSFQIAVQLFLNEYGHYPTTGDTNWHCLSSSANCVYAGVATAGVTGQLAQLLPEQESSSRFAFINKVEAASGLLNGLLPARPATNPLVIVGTTYSGPMYKCSELACKTAIVVFTTKNPIAGFSGAIRNGLTGPGGNVYQQAAEGSADSVTY